MGEDGGFTLEKADPKHHAQRAASKAAETQCEATRVFGAGSNEEEEAAESIGSVGGELCELAYEKRDRFCI